MDLASVNVAPRRGNTILEGFTIFIFQNGRDLEDYVEEFVGTCHCAICDDVCLMEGFRCGLDDDLRFALPDGDPCWTLQQYINLVLCACGSTYTVGEAEEDNNLPTADGEPEPRATAHEIATEPEPSESNQVREQATEPLGAEDSTAHCTTTEGEQCLDLGHSNMELDLIDFTKDIKMELPACPEQSVYLELSTCWNFPPTLPLLLPSSSHAASAIPLLFPDSPAAHPQSTICAVGLLRVYQSPSASWLEDPSSTPPDSESWTPPRPFDPAAPPRLSAPSSPPSPIGPPAPPGSIVPPAPPWLVVVPPSPQDSTPTAAPRRSVPPAPLGSSLPPALPQSSAAPAPPWPSGSSVSPWIFGSPSPPRAPPRPAPPPSVVSPSSTMAPPS
ncbi:hypothetical protein M9458_048661, partial [Cirrhinus mrigala]